AALQSQSRDVETNPASQQATIAVFAPLFPPAYRGGGPIRSIAALVESTPPGVLPLVLTSDRDLGTSEPLPVIANRWSVFGAADVYYVTSTSPSRLWHALKTLRRRRPDLLHL